MNADLIAAVILMHAPTVVAENTPNVWRTRCACGDVRDADAHARHVAEEIMVLAFPPAPPPAWSIPGVGEASQLAFEGLSA